MTNSNSNSNATRTLIIIAILAIIGVLAYAVLNAPDRRTTSERVSDAVEELPNGVDNAARELEDRTPGEKIGDAVKDVGEDIKDATSDNQ